MGIASRNTKGFTIVELLIVIVVIGILAAIVIVAFNGVQSRARDAQRKSDLASISKGINYYQTSSSKTIDTSDCGTGVAGSTAGSGWYSGTPGTAGTVSECMVSGKYLNKALIDPTKNDACDVLSAAPNCRAYAIVSCIASGSLTTIVYARLEVPGSTPAPPDPCGTTWPTAFGFNYSVRVQ